MDVREVVVGDQGGEVEIHLHPRAQRRIEIRLLPRPERGRGAFQHIHVQGEADGLDLPRLLVPKQFPRTPNFKIVGRQAKACAEIPGGFDGLEALLRIGGHGLHVGRQQVGIGLAVGPAHPPPKLV